MAARYLQHHFDLFPFNDGGRSRFAIGTLYPDRANSRDRIMSDWGYQPFPHSGRRPHDQASVKSPLDIRQQTIRSYSLSPTAQMRYNSGSDFGPPANCGRQHLL